MADQTKVMVIEDDATMGLLLETLLQLEGYCVVQVKKENSLNEMVDAVRNEKPALVLLDVHLRKVNGFDLLNQLRMDQDLKLTRVLLSSGVDYEQRSQETGADGFIMKPYMPDELMGKIKKALGA